MRVCVHGCVSPRISCDCVCDCITVSALYMWDWACKCGYQVSELLTAPSGTVHSVTVKLSLHTRGHLLSPYEGVSL